MKVSRIHRLLKLITLLQTGKQYLADDLASELNVSRRTLFRDLNLLKEAGIPLNFNTQVHSYTIDKEFFLPPVNFTYQEALGLMLLVQKYGSRAALPNFKAVGTAMMKIESSLPTEIREYCGSAMEKVDFRLTPMADASRASEVFELIWQASQQLETVRIVYDSYQENGEIQTRLNPFHLMFIGRAWYVIGYSSRHKEIRTFKLERMISATPTGKRFKPDHKFDPDTWFGNAWQMIKGARRYHVRIRFSPNVANTVEEVLWHHTQQTQRLEDGSLIYEVDVDGVKEISWWVLGYGSEAVVEEPEALRRIIHDHAQAMVAHNR